MNFTLDIDSIMKGNPFMDLSGIWTYNLDKSAFKAKHADTMSSSAVRELLNALNVDSMSNLAIFVPPWESSPVPKGIKYDHFWNELRQGNKLYDKVVGGSKIIVCKYVTTPYVMYFPMPSALNPSFIAFVKGTQPSI